jgi:hypothetical protein
MPWRKCWRRKARAGSWCHRLLATGGLLEDIFGSLVGVARVGVEGAAFGQVRVHLVPPSQVGFAAGVKVLGHAVAGGQHLHPVEPAVFADATVGIGLARQPLAAPEARVVAHGHGKRVQDVAGLGAAVLEQVNTSRSRCMRHEKPLLCHTRLGQLVKFHPQLRLSAHCTRKSEPVGRHIDVRTGRG